MTEGSPAQAAEPREKAKRSRPTKSLPTDRIMFSKQLDMLRAYAAASGPEGRPVGNKEVADILKMSESTTSLANAFFVDTGFLTRVEREFSPTREVREFQRAYEWNPDTAAEKLQPILRQSWCWSALSPRLGFSAMEEGEAIEKLAEASSAGPDYERQLRTILDFLAAAGLVEREGGMIKARSQSTPSSAESTSTSPSKEHIAAAQPVPRNEVAQPTPMNVIEFSISIRVDTSEISGWSAERISAFFGGFAQVLAAKGAMERAQSQQD